MRRGNATSHSGRSGRHRRDATPATVVRVIDGDTVKVQLVMALFTDEVAHRIWSLNGHATVRTVPQKGPIWYSGAVEYVTVPEAAAELGLTVWGVRRRIERGDMRAERLGAKVWAIPRQEVERWKARGRQRSGRKPKRQSAGSEETSDGQ